MPVSQRRGEIREALEGAQVVIVCGDTGSGKTTQLPKVALEMGRGVRVTKGRGRIGCTQPRRLAATSVAKRVAEELQVELGSVVGYQIRFEDRTDPERTAVKFMTDGILLAETRGDPDLKQYDTLIIDEAHERSLNIDFILGYVRRLLPRRPDLKVVISSATLDAETFSRFFGGAPVVQVAGRMYPVEDVYQPPIDRRERTADQVARAAEWLAESDPLGDTLVFLPGEREIRDAADLLDGRRYPNTVVLPLFARLAGKDQQAVFRPMPSRRRIILATNVAETSLTIPDIRSVIDCGTARVNRFDPVSGIQRLLVERISKASARQRRGRCGRVSEGVCVRLYDEEDFDSRQDYTDPEILRSNLAGVVLQMEHLRLGDPLKFPFVDRPQPKRVAQAYKTLEELGALWRKGEKQGLTDVGRTLARLPLDPRVGRILVAAEEEGCVQEALIIASALTVQDPRERPQERQQMADEAHARFRDKRSDFTGWLRWWHAVQEERKTSSNAVRRFCQKNFLNFRRLQEWMNLHRELRERLRDMKWRLPDGRKGISDPEGTYSEALHRAVLAGIPSQIGVKAEKEKGYRGARDRGFFLFPGSGVFKTSPPWVMAFEMVETAKLYARNVALFDPSWMEKVAPHLCRYRYANPHWVKEQGAVYGEETVMAFGLPVIEKRQVHYGRIDLAVAREIFVLEALVNGETRAPLPVLARNFETVRAAGRLEHKLRRRDGLLHPQAVVDFYQERVPKDVCTQKGFEKWASKQPEGALDLALEDCMVPLLEPLVAEDYPDALVSPEGGVVLDLKYLHDPSDEADGISVRLPLVEVPHLPVWFGDWLVPGWLEEKVSALVRALNKDLRRLLPSMREVVDEFLASWKDYEPDGPLADAVRDYIRSEFGVRLDAEAFEMGRVAEHLWMRYEVIDDEGRVLGSGRSFEVIQGKLAGKVKARFSEVSKGERFEKTRLRSWSVGDLEDEVAIDRRTVGYPGLVDAGDGTVGMRLWPSAACARAQHRLGVARLFRLVEADVVRRLEGVMFSSGGKGRGKVAASARVVAKAVKKGKGSGGDGFGALANAFGALGEVKVRKEPERKVAEKRAVVKQDAGGSLSAGQVLLLGRMGEEPGRNRDDLVTLVLTEVLGEPRTEAEWEAAVERARVGVFDAVGRVAGVLGELVDVAEGLSGMMEGRERVYDESVADAREHFARLLRPGWLLAGGAGGAAGGLPGAGVAADADVRGAGDQGSGEAGAVPGGGFGDLGGGGGLCLWGVFC